MDNPLTSLCGQLGLSRETLARFTGLKETQIDQALSLEPREPLAAFLKLLGALGAKLRLRLDAPLKVWFEIAAVHELHYCSRFRRSLGMEPLPASRRELRDLIARMRRRGRSYGQIVEHLEANYIPTSMGVRHWRRGTIAQHLRALRGRADENAPLGATDPFLADFRRFVTERLLIALFPFDALGPVRYEADTREEDGRILIETKAPIASSLRAWILKSIADLGWFAPDRWGEIQGDT